MKEKKVVKRSVSFPESTLATLDKIAADRHIATSALVREYVNKGLSIDGYIQDIDLISGIVRDEVQAEIGKQAERIVKLIVKIGKISSANFYSNLAVLLQTGVCNSLDLAQLEREAVKRGIAYMKTTGTATDERLEDVDELLEQAGHL